MRRTGTLVGVVTVGLAALLSGCSGTSRTATAPDPVRSPEATASSASAPTGPELTATVQALVQQPAQSSPASGPPAAAAPAAGVVGGVLLHAAPGGDGDSWKDTTGREYRLGLVNTPEVGECGGSTATRVRKRLVAAGFRAAVYTTDDHGRSVAEVTTADGTNLNVYLARNGYANDRYLAQFRSERPRLAAQLDQAFAAAKAEHRGVWGTCSAPTPTPAPTRPAGFAGSACHPDYVTCIPVKGDGSGVGEANDLDCGDLRKKVQLRRIGVDPYRLDSNGDGFGCETYG